MSYGFNWITVTVTAQDRSTSVRYSIAAYRALPGPSALLSGLTLSTGTLYPPFNEGQMSYSSMAPMSFTTTLTATALNPLSTITVSANSLPAVAANSGTGLNLNLQPGANIISVRVRAYNGYVQLYTINVYSNQGTVSTLAGSGRPSISNLGQYLDNGTGTNARFLTPTGVALDAENNIYVVEQQSGLIRFINMPTAFVAAFAGNNLRTGRTPYVNWADGTATQAGFTLPFGIAINSSGDIYIGDAGDSRIRMIQNEVVSTVAGNECSPYQYNDGTGAGACFMNAMLNAYNGGPTGLAIDSSNNIYAADSDRIRKISTQAVVTTVATGFSMLTGIAINSGNNLFVIDQSGNIYKIAPGGAPVLFATIPSQTLAGIALDTSGNLYATSQSQVYVITPNGQSSVLAGNLNSGFADGTGTAAQFNNPAGLAVDSSGNVYVADYNNNRIRVIK